MWAVDSFGSLVHDAVFERSDVPDDLDEGTFDVLKSWNPPWMEWLDVDPYAAHVSTTRSLAPSIVAPMPGQDTLDLMLAAALVGEGMAA